MPKISILTSILLAVFSASVAAKTWDEAIQAVGELAERYKSAADKKSGEVRFTKFLGSVHSVWDIDIHTCAILGRHFGQASSINHLEPPQPPLDSEFGVLLDNYASLLTWIRAAQRYRGMSLHQRAKHWNLECVGQKGIRAALWVDVPPGTFYEIDQYYLWVFGDISPGFAAKLTTTLLKNPGIKTVGLGSGGGSVYEAIRAGRAIRKLGLSTQLSGDCVSACPLVFLGGVSRNVMRPFPKFGFHKVSVGGKAVPVSDAVYADIWHYVREMGANANLIIEAMQAQEPSELGYFTPDMACESGMATWYQSGGSLNC